MASSGQTDGKEKDYKLMQLIGKGCSDAASIHLAKCRRTDSYVAVKVFNLELLDQANMDLGLIQHELLVGRQLQHENIMTSQKTFTTQQDIWSVMPVCGYGSCKDLLCSHFSTGLPEAAIAFILYDVIKALDYLHSQGIIHRSVKASHILLSSEGQVRLSGLRYSYNMLRNGSRHSQVHQFPDHYLKSLLWAAPEILQQNVCGYNTSSDVYSLGITACELANGAVPFADMDTTQMLLAKLKGVSVPRLWDSYTLQEDQPDAQDESYSENEAMVFYSNRQFSPHFHDFVEICLQAEPHLRPPCSQLLQHSFFKQVRRKAVGPSVLPELLLPVQSLTTILQHLGAESGEEAEDRSGLVDQLEHVTLDGGWDF